MLKRLKAQIDLLYASVASGERDADITNRQFKKVVSRYPEFRYWSQSNLDPIGEFLEELDEAIKESIEVNNSKISLLIRQIGNL